MDCLGRILLVDEDDEEDAAAKKTCRRARNCVGLLTSNHMMGKSHPGGFQEGFFKDAYHSGEGVSVGKRLCWIDIETPPLANLVTTEAA